MKAKERRQAQILDIVDAGRSNQSLQTFNKMKGRELSQAIEMALSRKIENSSLKHSIKTHHLSKQGNMTMRALHALLMKQSPDFTYYKSLRTRVMEKLSHDPAMLGSYLGHAQNATAGWEDTAFKEVVKTAPNGEDLYGFIGIVSFNGKRYVTPHVVFDSNSDDARHKANQTLLHNIMDKNLKRTSPEHDEEGHDFIQVHPDGNVSYHKFMNRHDAASSLECITEKFGLVAQIKKERTTPITGVVTYSFELSASDEEGQINGMCEVFTKTATSRPAARQAAAIEAFESRMMFEVTGFTLLPKL